MPSNSRKYLINMDLLFHYGVIPNQEYISVHGSQDNYTSIIITLKYMQMIFKCELYMYIKIDWFLKSLYRDASNCVIF